MEPLISLFPWSILMFWIVCSLITALTVKYLTQRFIMEYDPYIDGKYSKLDMVGNEPVIIRVRDTYTHSGVSSSAPISILYVYLHSLKGKQLPNWECKCHHVSFILFHLSSMQNNVHLLLLWSGPAKSGCSDYISTKAWIVWPNLVFNAHAALDCFPNLTGFSSSGLEIKPYCLFPV